MIPAPKYRNHQGSCCWELSEQVALWWFSHVGRWSLTMEALGSAATVSVSIDLGREAPAALLLLAHQRRTP